MRTYDGVGHYGGEEFLIVLPGCDLVNAFTRADQIRTCVANEPISTSIAPKRVTMSMGVATDQGEVKLETLLNLPDLGLYRAKRNGRNRVKQVDESEEAAATGTK